MQSFNLNLVPGSFQQVFNCSQGDVDRQLTIRLFDGSAEYTVPVGATVKIKATKPSGFGFNESATFSGSAVTITTTETMTNEWGRFPAELEITNEGLVIGTANFLFNVEKNPHPASTVDGDAEEVIPELTLLVERVEAAASSVLDMEVVAETLPAGSQATYSYDEDLNKATFGIPQGEAGAGAAGVVASAYSSSKTYKVGDYAIHNSNLYRCITAITTAEAFTAAHWTQVVLADDVSDLKTDLNITADSFQFDTLELFNANNTTDGYYPAVGGSDPGDLAPNANAGTTDWIFVKPFQTITFKPKTGGAHNFCFYDENKNFVYGFIQNLTADVDFVYTPNFETYPNICYMRMAFYLTEKAQFSIIGEYSDDGIKDFTKETATSNPTSYDFADGTTPASWSVKTVGTFWMTANPIMVAMRGKKLLSLKYTALANGETLTVRGYDDAIPMNLSASESAAAAVQANQDGYDLFRIINATAGESTYRLDGTDDRVEILSDSLICPTTIGLFKDGDTGFFRYYNANGTTPDIYFTHRAMSETQMKPNRIGVEFTTGEIDSVELSIVKKNNEKLSVLLSLTDFEMSSRFSTMKMNCLGDSITYGYIPDSGAQMANPYPKLLKEILGLAECRNYGISGSTLAVNSGNYDPMCERYADMSNDADIVLVFGGTNDYGRAVYTPTLGEITDNVNTTVYGALNILCEGLITKYPKALIFLCTPLKRADKTAPNGGGYTLEDVADAIREVGQKFGMPVLDLNYKGGFYISNATFRAQYGGDDKLHPNQAFDEQHLAPMIARFIDGLM